jgi:GxxExxY protein
MSDVLLLCDRIRRTSLAIHEYLRSGHLEKVYENALVHRLRKQGVELKQQMPIDIYDEDGTQLGHYVADLLVEGELIVELKACQSLTVEHFAQIFGYLRGSKLRHGLLINFGARKLQIRKLIL